MNRKQRKQLLGLLKLHHLSFDEANSYAKLTGHPVPSDTRAWSQILVSIITGIQGIKRKKGPDLSDGSDVKAANTWEAIDTPRFNGVTKAGTKSLMSGKLKYLNSMPYIFFVLWDKEPNKQRERCRVWAVRPQTDKLFRKMCDKWYKSKTIKSNNFQLQPPRNKNSNVFTGTFGNLEYPILFKAEWYKNHYRIKEYKPGVLKNGNCKEVN